MKLRSGSTAGAAASTPSSPDLFPPSSSSTRLDDLPQALHLHLLQYLNLNNRKEVTLTSKTWCLLCRSLTTATKIGWQDSRGVDQGEDNPISPAQVESWLSLRPHLEKLTFLSCLKRSLPIIGISQRLVTKNLFPNLRHFRLSTAMQRMEMKAVVDLLRSMPLLEKLELDQVADLDRFYIASDENPETPGLPAFFQALAEGVCPRLRLLELESVIWGNEQRDSFVDALEARQRDHPQCPGLTIMPYDMTAHDEGDPAFRRFLRLYLATSLEVLNGVRGEDWDGSMLEALLECFLSEEMKSAKALKHLLLANIYRKPSDEVSPARDAILAAGKAPNLTTLHIRDIGEFDTPALEELCFMLSTNRWPFLEDLCITPSTTSSLQVGIALTSLVDAMVGSSYGFPYLRVLKIDIDVEDDGEDDQAGAAAVARAEQLLTRDKFPVLRVFSLCRRTLEDSDEEG